MKRAAFLFLALAFCGAEAHAAVIGQLETKRERMRREQGTTRTLPAQSDHIHEAFLKEDYAAVERLTAAIPLSQAALPESGELLQLRALSLMQLGRGAEARQVLEALEREAVSEIRSSAAVSRADSFARDGDELSAFLAYEETARRYPDCGEAPYVLARLSELATKLNRSKEAEYFKQRLLTEFPDSPSAHQFSKNLTGSPGALRQFGLIEEQPLFSVQVGSFSREENARSLLHGLIARHYEAYLYGPGRERLWRVRVGRPASREEAHSLEARLKGDGYPAQITS